MAELNEHIEVDVPVETAYEAWSNFELFPRYLPYIERITPAGDGVHHHWVVTIGGVRREFDTEVTEQVPNQRIAWSSTAGEQQSRCGWDGNRTACSRAWLQPRGSATGHCGMGSRTSSRRSNAGRAAKIRTAHRVPTPTSLSDGNSRKRLPVRLCIG
jgi:uncharacterized protein YndB with AHSA1/START domain